MIIKYNDNIILKDWQEDDYGHIKVYNKIIILVGVNYYNIDASGKTIASEKLLAIKNKFKIEFYNDFEFMEPLFGNLMIEGNIKNIKQQVDNFIIKISKLKELNDN